LFFKICSFLLLIILIRDSNDYIIYALISIIGTAGNYIFNIIYSKRFVNFSLNNLNLKQHLKSIMYLVVVNLAIEIYSLVDITMLGFMSHKENVAFYSYAIKIYKVLLQIINSFTMVLVPKIALYYKENKIDEYNYVITKTLKAILLLSIPMVIGILFTSDFLICLLYGNKYIRSANVLKIVSWIIIISPIGYLLGSRICLVTNNERKMVLPVACGAIVNLILNYIFIPKYNEIGAAIASLIGELVVMIIYINLGKKYVKLVGMKELYLKQSIAIFGMIFILFILSIFIINGLVKTLLQIIFSSMVYFGILLFIKEEFVYEKFIVVKRKILRR